MALQNARKGAGLVISAGKMAKTVTVQMTRREWNRRLRKNYFVPYKFLVHDPNNSLIEGDVITCVPEKHSSRVSYVVSSILAPFGKPIHERPPVLSETERGSLKESTRQTKVERRAARGVSSAVEEAKQRGWSHHSESAEQPNSVSTGNHGQLMEHGRTVLPGGQHRYGGRGEGGIEKEAWTGKQRAMQMTSAALKNEEERDAAEARLTDEVAKQQLRGS